MIKNLIDADEPDPQRIKASSGMPSILSSDTEQEGDEPFILSETEPMTIAETVRKSGLAYSAGIVLFASVVFLLIIGWGADLLFGSSPWGVVIGIGVGSLIGFVQFFRITSQIFRK